MHRVQHGSFFGSKNDKMESKFQVNMGTICWICHQDKLEKCCEIEKKKVQSHPLVCLFKKVLGFRDLESGKSYSEKEEQKFCPCLCKGSLGKVHRYCLNKWVLQQYRQWSSNYKINETEEAPTETEREETFNLFCIKCPNCRYPYNYRIYEEKKLMNLKKINLFTKEKIILFLLLILQIVFLLVDLKYNFFGEGNSNDGENQTTSNGSSIQDMSNMFYFFTMFVIICAAGFNVVEIFVKKVKVDVLDKD